MNSNLQKQIQIQDAQQHISTHWRPSTALFHEYLWHSFWKRKLTNSLQTSRRIVFTCTKEQAMVPLLSWFSRVSQTATSGTLVTPSVIIMMPETCTSSILQCDKEMTHDDDKLLLHTLHSDWSAVWRCVSRRDFPFRSLFSFFTQLLEYPF